MSTRKREFLIVGSGAGGAALARALARKQKDVLVVEKGRHERAVGTFGDARRFFDGNWLTKTPKRAEEGAILWRTFMAGGTTVVSCGNATRCLEKELRDLGIDLREEFEETEREMNVAPVAESLLSEGSAAIREASSRLGYRMELMPKFVDPTKCRRCGLCVMGCKNGAKWTALEYVQGAQAEGAEILYESTVEAVLVERAKASGVRVVGPHGRMDIPAEVVILAAGGLATPVILQKLGVKDAGQGLFIDLLVNTYGVTKTANQLNEPSMALVNRDFHEEQGFILSPFVNIPRMVRLMEGGLPGSLLPASKLLGIMTKIADEPAGRVYPDGSVSKPVTDEDWKKLNGGSSIARRILEQAGAAATSILVTSPQGAHPGGTAAIGKIVDRDLQSPIDNLFVCDASVLPAAPGLPPIVTITALAKRLAKTLAA